MRGCQCTPKRALSAAPRSERNKQEKNHPITWSSIWCRPDCQLPYTRNPPNSPHTEPMTRTRSEKLKYQPLISPVTRWNSSKPGWARANRGKTMTAKNTVEKKKGRIRNNFFSYGARRSLCARCFRFSGHRKPSKGLWKSSVF